MYMKFCINVFSSMITGGWGGSTFIKMFFKILTLQLSNCLLYELPSIWRLGALIDRLAGH